jgi:hypothetical protein
MPISKAAKAAPAATGGDLRSIERFGGLLDLHAIKYDLQVQHLVRRLRLPPLRAELVARLAFGGGRQA